MSGLQAGNLGQEVRHGGRLPPEEAPALLRVEVEDEREDGGEGGGEAAVAESIYCRHRVGRQGGDVGEEEQEGGGREEHQDNHPAHLAAHWTLQASRGWTTDPGDKPCQTIESPSLSAGLRRCDIRGSHSYSQVLLRRGGRGLKASAPLTAYCGGIIWLWIWVWW